MNEQKVKYYKFDGSQADNRCHKCSYHKFLVLTIREDGWYVLHTHLDRIDAYDLREEAMFHYWNPTITYGSIERRTAPKCLEYYKEVHI